MKKELLIFQGENGEILLKEDIKNETVWANLDQIANLFGRDKSTISRHIKNVFKTGELSQEGVVAFFATTASDGKKYNVEFFNLDLIISVGYRVNSKIATKFRKWATSVLKDHITKGFTINKNIIERNYNEFLKAVENLKVLTSGKEIGNDEILNLVSTFAHTWFSLDSFDKGELPTAGFTKKTIKLEIEKLYNDIEILKNDLIKKNLATKMFAQEKSIGNLSGIFGNIFASFDGVDLYETVEEKSVHLLYFVIKNHPFNDGNKRTGAFCFIWFLQKYNINFKTKISPETLTTLTLLIAQSDPKEKEKMIGLVLMLLK